MKILLGWVFVISMLFANDATIDVIKKVQALPSIAIEDSSVSYDDTFKSAYKALKNLNLNVSS